MLISSMPSSYATYLSHADDDDGLGSQESLSSRASTAAITTTTSEASQATSADTPESDCPEAVESYARPIDNVTPHWWPHSSHQEQRQQQQQQHRYHHLHHQPQQRLRTPEDKVDVVASANGHTRAPATPNTVTRPVNSHKRTASGLVKTMERPLTCSPVETVSRTSVTRSTSVGSAGSKASEHAANLKDRLAYAMAKVQHGWEHRNIDEVERLAAAASLAPRYASRQIMPRHNHRSSSGGSPSPPTHSYRIDHSMVALAPAANVDLRPLLPPHTAEAYPRHLPLSPRSPIRSPSGRQYHRHSEDRQQHQPYAPTTPKSHHNHPMTSTATVRNQTQTAAAEQEAMDALLLMGSPRNSAFPLREGVEGAGGGEGGGEGDGRENEKRKRHHHHPSTSSAATILQSPSHHRPSSRDIIQGYGVRNGINHKRLSKSSISDDSQCGGDEDRLGSRVEVGMRDRAAAAAIMRARGSVLDQIEADSC